MTSTTDPGAASKRAGPIRLLVLCPFPQGVAAGQRLKYEQYFDDWRAHGYHIIVSSFMDEALWNVAYKRGHTVEKLWGGLRGQLRRVRDLLRVSRFDLVYVFMWVTPVGPPFFEWLTRKLARRMIVDVEDNVMIGQGISAEHSPNALLKLLKGRAKAGYLIRTADHVITSSPFLNDDCLKINAAQRCTYITSSVETDRYVAHGPRPPGEPVTIGWTGTFSSLPFLELVHPVLQRLARNRRFRLVVIGNFPYRLEGVDTEVIQWTKEREIADLQKLDIGLYPLPAGDWVLGKSGLKAIQYMAMGIPTVATRVGMSPRVLRDGVTGLLVETEDEWLAALQRLIDDPELRERMGREARRDAEDRYSVRKVRSLYLNVLNEVAGAAARPRRLAA